jgi:hypothetical protein
MTVVVNEKDILIKYGVGIIRKRIALNEIKSCKPVRNKWWYGFGIRYIKGRGWLYSIAGPDAIELEMKNEKKIIIGTDESDYLSGFMQQIISKN